MKKFLILLIVAIILVMGTVSILMARGTTTTAIATINRDLLRYTIVTDANQGEVTLDMYGVLVRLGVELSGSVTDANDANGPDLTIRDEYDATLISDVNVTDGTRYAPVSCGVDANNVALGVPVAGAIDVNWTGLKPAQTATYIFWLKSTKGW